MYDRTCPSSKEVSEVLTQQILRTKMSSRLTKTSEEQSEPCGFLLSENPCTQIGEGLLVVDLSTVDEFS
jgi:hypothetical protein